MLEEANLLQMLLVKKKTNKASLREIKIHLSFQYKKTMLRKSEHVLATYVDL